MWATIVGELQRSRYLLVLCSPAAAKSKWVDREIRWFAEHRGVEWILLAVTDPAVRFPPAVEELGIRRIWYDFRAFGATTARAKEPEDELVRLVADLLEWDAERDGPLAAIWMREQTRRRRRSARITTIVAAVITVLAIFATIFAIRAARAAERARTNAIVLAARSASDSDPLTGMLLLREILDVAAGGDAPQASADLARHPIPVAMLRGPVGRITYAAFADAATVVTASTDGTVRIARADGRGAAREIRVGEMVPFARVVGGGTRIVTLRPGEVAMWNRHGAKLHSTPIGDGYEGFAVSPRGELVATIFSGANGLQVWQPAANRHSQIPVDGVTDVWLHDEGRGLFATNKGDVHSFAIDAAGGRIVQQRLPPIEPPRETLAASPVGDAEFSEDGALVATVFANMVFLRRVDGSTPPRLLRHPAPVTDVRFSRSGARMVTASADGIARVWSTAAESEPESFDSGEKRWVSDLELGPGARTLEPYPMRFAAFSPDERLIAAFQDDGVVRVWEIGRKTGPLELRNRRGVETLAFREDGRAIVTGTDDGVAAVWLLDAPREPIVLQHEKNPRVAAFDPSGTRVASVDDDGVVRLWTIATRAATVIGGNASGCAFSHDGSFVATAQKDGLVRIWRGSAAAKTIGTAHGELDGVLVSPDDQFVFARANRVVYRWRADGRAGELAFAGPDSELWGLALSGDGKRLLAWYGNGSAVIWPSDDPTRGIELPKEARHAKAIFGGALSHDGSVVALASYAGTGTIWRIGKPPVNVAPFDKDVEMTTAGITRDGSTIALASFAGDVALFDASGKERTRLRAIGEIAHIGAIGELAFSNDGRWLATSGSVDASARLWDVTGAEKPVTLEHEGLVQNVAFTRDGRRLLTLSEDGKINVWFVRWTDRVRDIAGRTTATLAPRERVALLGESEDDAWQAYAREEKSHGRTPLPRDWRFRVPSF